MKGCFSKLTLTLISLGIASTGFATTDLMSVYQQALQNDPTYKGAEATYASTKQSLPLAYANLLPTIAGTGSYNYANSASPDGKQHYWARSWGATLQQNIFDWSAIAGVSKAKAGVRGALATYQAAKQTLIQSTISAYLTVVQNAATVQYDEAYSNQLAEFLKQQKQKYKVGIIPVTQVYQAQSNYDTQYAQTITDKNTLNSDIEQLRTITNHAYSSIKGVNAALPLHSPNPNNMETWVSTALKQNLSIIGARAQVDADKATISGDHGAHLPSVNFQGGYQQSYTANKAINATMNHNVSNVGFNLSLPIFNGGSMFAQTRQDAYTQEADQQALDATIRSTIANTRSNYMSIIAAINGVTAAKQAYLSADKSLKAVQAGYQVGTNTISDVLTAMADRVQQQESIVTNQVAYLNAIIALKQEAGILNDRDVKAISKILNENVSLPNTIKSNMSGNTSTKAAMTTAQKASKASSTAHVTNTTTTNTAIHKISGSAPTTSFLTTSGPAKTNSAATNAPYSIQLFLSNSQTRAKSFIQNYLDNSSEAFISSHVTNGQTYYAVMYGHYDTAAQAGTAISHLSNAVQRLKPFAKKVS